MAIVAQRVTYISVQMLAFRGGDCRFRNAFRRVPGTHHRMSRPKRFLAGLAEGTRGRAALPFCGGLCPQEAVVIST